MVDDPRMGIRDRLSARSAAWKHQQQHAQNVAQRPAGVGGQAAFWEQQASGHQQSQKQNPFSGEFKSDHYVQLNKDDRYGKPPEGSKTEFRGKQAGLRISGEIVELCQVIASLGTEQADGTYAITFGALFEAYTRISNKLVGMLMRARKQSLIRFKGEMLFQRRDDDVIVWLLKRPEKLLEEMEQQKQELREHAAFGTMQK